MSDYPATTLALNKEKYYVLLTIPVELREHFNGRKQLKQSTGTSDPQIAKQKQHNISSELYAKLDECKPDPRDIISDLLGWIGDAEEIQRLEDSGDLEGTILAHKYAENMDDPEDPDDDCTDLVNEGGAKALEAHRQWKATQRTHTSQSGSVYLSVALEEYLSTNPYGPIKTMRDCKLSISQFKDFTGDRRRPRRP